MLFCVASHLLETQSLIIHGTNGGGSVTGQPKQEEALFLIVANPS